MSDGGLGALVPSALRAIAQLADAGIISSNYTENATTWAETWETEASQFFEVSIDSATATSRLTNYVTEANLTEALLYGAGALNDTQSAGSGGNSSAGGWGESDQVIGGGSANSTFYALSINREGNLVEVCGDRPTVAAVQEGIDDTRSSTLISASCCCTPTMCRLPSSRRRWKRCSRTPAVS